MRAHGMLVFALLLAGCDGDPGAAMMMDAGTTADAAPAPLDAPPGSTTERLLASVFEIPVGQELYQCQRVTVTAALSILRVAPVSPAGVHHQVLAIDESHTMPDGVSRCGAFGRQWRKLFAAGVGSDALDLPAGVALNIPAGAQLVLNLHLFNATDAPITGTAALDVLRAGDGSSLTAAGTPFVGNVGFTVPGTAPFTVDGECTIDRKTRLFAVLPHMHQTGEHMKIWLETRTGPRVIWDQPFDFADQGFVQFAPIELDAGDKLKLTCTYSPAGANKPFGDSSNDEMCFAVSYLAPALLNGAGACTN